MSFQIKRNHAKPPAGGHRFVKDNVTLTGETVDEVLEKIQVHRAVNSLPLGDPEQELCAYYKDIAPYLVRESEAESVPRSPAIIQAEAINRVWRERRKTSRLPAIIELRRETCERCPLRGSFHAEESDNRYIQEAHRRAQLLTDSLGYKAAGLCGWSNLPVAIITKLEQPDQLPGLPDVPEVCWVRSP